MQYFFVLGNNSTLSAAELSAVFKLTALKTAASFSLTTDNIFLINTNTHIDINQLIQNLGGVIKAGEIKTIVNNKNKEELLKEFKEIIGLPVGKFNFGFSYYGRKKIDIKPLAMEIKKYLRKKGVKSRWVTSRAVALSSVVVEQNKLTADGIEIIFIDTQDGLLIGRTLAVQPFKDLSYRDYGRPARDDRSGMLPPKLAQIMINLSGLAPLLPDGGRPREEAVILDPFCGSGTILTEAMLMGFKNIIGADFAGQAIQDTEKNIKWTLENYKLETPNYELYNINAAKLSKNIKPRTIDAIITEPYLGPASGRHDIKKTVQELERLYFISLFEFKKILRPEGRVIMVLPVFHTKRGLRRVFPEFNSLKIINPVPSQLLNCENIKLTNRNTIIYGREKQRIWREIIILKPIKK